MLDFLLKLLDMAGSRPRLVIAFAAVLLAFCPLPTMFWVVHRTQASQSEHVRRLDLALAERKTLATRLEFLKQDAWMLEYESYALGLRMEGMKDSLSDPKVREEWNTDIAKTIENHSERAKYFVAEEIKIREGADKISAEIDFQIREMGHDVELLWPGTTASLILSAAGLSILLLALLPVVSIKSGLPK